MKAIRFLFLFISIGVVTGCFESSRAAPTELADKYTDSVVLYSTSWCGYCAKTRELFTSRNIKYIELDIEASSTAKLEFDKLGGRGIPLVLVKGRVVEGYAPNAVLELLKRT